MESVEQYYDAKKRLYITIALLLTWEFFSTKNLEVLDVEFLKVSFNSNLTIPFLLSILIFFNTYTLVFHWKLIKEEKNSSVIKDYMLTLVISSLSVYFSFFHEMNTSKYHEYLLNTTEPVLWVVASIAMIFVGYKFPDLIKSKTFMFFAWLSLFSSCGSLIYSFYLLKKQFNLNAIEFAYFYAIDLINLVVYPWAMSSLPNKEDTKP